jgi:NTE family protein
MYGLVLAGGGAKGAYQIGAWKALRELQLDIQIVCGTSVGALNGAFIAQNKYNEALNMWENINMSTIFRDNQGTVEMVEKIYTDGIMEASFDTIKHLYNHITKNKGLNVDPLRELVANLLDEERLQSTGIEFGLVTINLSEKKPLKIYASELKKGELKYYLLGSALFPGFNQDKTHPVKFFDGGIVDNLPIKMVIEKGFKDIIAVSLKHSKKPRYKNINLTYISPSESLGSMLHFNQEKSKRNITMGYLDTLKTFKKIFGIKYYFSNIPKEKAFVYKLLTIPNKERIMLCRHLGMKENYSNRYLFEKTLPKLSSLLGLKSKDNYIDILYAVTEKVMQVLNIDRLVLYDIDLLIESLLKEEITNTDAKIYIDILKAIH